MFWALLSRVLYCGPSALQIRVCGVESKEEPGVPLEVFLVGGATAPSLSEAEEMQSAPGQPSSVREGL